MLLVRRTPITPEDTGGTLGERLAQPRRRRARRGDRRARVGPASAPCPSRPRHHVCATHRARAHAPRLDAARSCVGADGPAPSPRAGGVHDARGATLKVLRPSRATARRAGHRVVGGAGRPRRGDRRRCAGAPRGAAPGEAAHAGRGLPGRPRDRAGHVPRQLTRPRADARTIAHEILVRVETDMAFADVLLRHHLGGELPANERALASELVYGTLTWQGRLDHHLSGLLHEPLARTRAVGSRRASARALPASLPRSRPGVRAVDATVRLTPRRASGLVNAVLRRAPGPDAKGCRFPTAIVWTVWPSNGRIHAGWSRLGARAR